VAVDQNAGMRRCVPVDPRVSGYYIVLRAPFGATWRPRKRVAIIIRSTPIADAADHCADACDVKAENEGD
jgi:hypothetical protein